MEAEQGGKTEEKSPRGAGRRAVRVCRSGKLSPKIHFLLGAAAAAAPAAGRSLDGRSAPGTRGSPPSYLQARGAAPPPVQTGPPTPAPLPREEKSERKGLWVGSGGEGEPGAVRTR